MCVSSTGQAALSPRVQVSQRGGFVMIGNTLAQDCVAGVPAPVVGLVGGCGSNSSEFGADLYWQADAPGPGQATANLTVPPFLARSKAVLQLPPGARSVRRWIW